MVLKLPRLSTGGSIVDKDGKALVHHTRNWDDAMTAIETAFNDIADTLAAVIIAQAAAVAAQAAAVAAQASADAAATTVGESSALQSLQTSGVDETCVITGRDVGADAEIEITPHDRLYGDNPTAAVAGGFGVGLAYSTTYWIYYDDPSRAGGIVVYFFVTTNANAFPSATNPDRHYVGKVTTPAALGADTDGDPNFWAG